jgi:hypothetical protein
LTPTHVTVYFINPTTIRSQPWSPPVYVMEKIIYVDDKLWNDNTSLCSIKSLLYLKTSISNSGSERE